MNKFEPPAHVFAVLDVRHQLPRVGAVLGPAVVERRPVHARLHGLGPAARRVRRGVVLRPEHDPRREPAEAVPDVAERRPAAGDDLVGHAQQVHLRHRLHVVRRVAGELVLLVARLVHAHDLSGGRRRLPVLPPYLLVVPRAEAGHQDGLGPRAAARRRLLRHRHVGEQVFLRSAGEDLVQDVLERGVSVEHPHLDAQPFVRAPQVRPVEPRHQPPNLVRRVEQVVRQEVEHRVLPREHPVELVLVRRVQEQRRHEVPVRPHHQPRRAPEELPLAVVAEEELVVVRARVVEVHEHVPEPGRRRRRRAVVLLHQVPVALPHVARQVLEVADREPRRQQPRRPRERLAEDVAQRRLAAEEQDAVGEHGVEERRRHGQDPVPEPPVRHQHQVPAGAAGVVVVVAAIAVRRRSEPRRRGPVRLGARAAPALQRLVLAQPPDEVRGRRPRQVLAVERGLVAAEARPLVEPRHEQAADKLLCIRCCTRERRKKPEPIGKNFRSRLGLLPIEIVPKHATRKIPHDGRG
uniref:Uncharacterized protein n=1 Tax=Zea mays TaxID=4577 RepID=A0A804PX18_MAIZE